MASRVLGLFAVALLIVVLAGRSLRARADEGSEAVIVLAGGVDDAGRPHETVLRRLRRAAKLHKLARERGNRLIIVTNGGGTTHKPKWVSPAGYAVPEAALMARVLEEDGVPPEDIYLEGYSDDTIGNAFYARTMHADPAGWRRLLVITSEFQMARTIAIYEWVFGLAPLPAGLGGRPYSLSFDAVADRNALAPHVLAVRQKKEAASLRAFEAGELVKMTTLAQLHRWLHTRHSAYTAAGVLGKQPLNRSSALSATY